MGPVTYDLITALSDVVTRLRSEFPTWSEAAVAEVVANIADELRDLGDSDAMLPTDVERLSRVALSPPGQRV